MERISTNFKITLLLSLTFFLVAFLTLTDYGVSWDEAVHFRRGHAYVHYFLTGNKNYDDLAKIDLQATEGKPENIPSPRRSFYQNDYHNGEHWEIYDIGHPPLSDELSALFNVVFFQILGIMDDLASFHTYNILAASLIVFFAVYFMSASFGKFAGVVTFLTLVTYPLFWSESHFNMKDVSQAAFFTGFIFSFYKSLKPSKTWLFSSSVFFALALGTKFNILFAPFIVAPYLLFRLWREPIKISKGYIMTILSWPLVVLIIFVGSWPFLWQNPSNIFKIFNYYHQVGVGTNYQPEQFYWFGFNTFPWQWIIVTTPPLVLIIFTIGLFSCWKNRYKFHSITILWLLWFLVPLVRISLPGVSIYGGVRQIFEFIPALALISGMGAYQIVAWLKAPKLKNLVIVSMILLFFWPMYILTLFHPNENVYFNFLIGGLPGAAKSNFPSWGNSFGNAYLQGIRWINQNAEVGAKLSLIQGTPANAPAIFIRKDINYNNANWSGAERKGEYLMELYFNDTTKTPAYAWEYVDKFLEPVYELKVTGTPILKIWKNDLQHTKNQYKIEVEYKGNVGLVYKQGELKISLADQVNLSKLDISFVSANNCNQLTDGYIETSVDGVEWIREQDGIPSMQVGHDNNFKDNNLKFHFAGRAARFIRVIGDHGQNCFLEDLTAKVYIF